MLVVLIIAKRRESDAIVKEKNPKKPVKAISTIIGADTSTPSRICLLAIYAATDKHNAQYMLVYVQNWMKNLKAAETISPWFGQNLGTYKRRGKGEGGHSHHV